MTQISPDLIRARIKDMLLANTTIANFSPTVKVYDDAVLSLNRAVLPAFLISDNGGTFDNTNMGHQYIKPSDNYLIDLYAQEWTPQAELTILTTKIDALRVAIEDTFTFYRTLNLNGSDLQGIRDAKLISHTPIRPQPFPRIAGAPVYVHKSWTLQIIYTRKVENG